MKSALLLAAGKATRLQGIRDQYAKACVPIGDTTPLKFMIGRLIQSGIGNMWVNMHWLPDQVLEHACFALKEYGDDRADGPIEERNRLNFIEEPELLGTGGTLLEYYQRNGSLPDLIINAKQFGDVDLKVVVQQPVGTLVLHSQSKLSDFGGLRFDENFNISGLLAKSEAAKMTSSGGGAGLEASNSTTHGVAVFTGICRPDPAWLPYLQQAREDNPQQVLCMLRHGMFPAMADGVTARAYLHDGDWYEISTPERVKEAVRRRRAECGSPHAAQ